MITDGICSISASIHMVRYKFGSMQSGWTQATYHPSDASLGFAEVHISAQFFIYVTEMHSEDASIDLTLKSNSLPYYSVHCFS